MNWKCWRRNLGMPFTSIPITNLIRLTPLGDRTRGKNLPSSPQTPATLRRCVVRELIAQKTPLDRAGRRRDRRECTCRAALD